MRTEADVTNDGGLLGPHLEPLRAKRDEVWEEMVSTIQHEEPSYTRFASPEEEAEWGEGVLTLFDLFLELAREDRRHLTPLEMEAIRSVGRRRADQGFDFPALRASVRAAVGVARRYIVDEYSPSEPGDKAALRQVLEFLAWYGSQVEDLLHDGLDACNKDRVTRGARELARLIEDIETETITDDTELARRIGAAGCAAGLDRALVLLPDNHAGLEAARTIRTELETVSVLRRSGAATPHLLALVGMPITDKWASVMAVVHLAATKTKTTALAVRPCKTTSEYHDRYAAAAVLVPHVGTLAGGQSILDVAELTPYSVVASLPPTARQWLRREVLRGVETMKKLVDFLGVSIQFKFTLTSIEQSTGWDIKTVYSRRDQLEEVTGRRYADPGDQAALVLGYCAAQIGP
jgi:hypothetical protein